MLSDTTDNSVGLNIGSGQQTAIGDYPNELKPGVFQVGPTGQVSFRNELHNAAYQSDIAIVKFSGLENYEIGSSAFIQEATRRALSNSVFGHIIVSDPTEAPRFNEGPNRSKSRKYLGNQTFEMTPGDQVIFMLFPNTRAKDVLTNPNSEAKPFYSLAELNSDKASHFTLFRRTLNSGLVFSVEDLPEDGRSDRDFNDNVFYTQGLIGDTESFNNLINPRRNWRNSEIGEELLYGDLNPPFLGKRLIPPAVGGGFGDPDNQYVSINSITNTIQLGDKIILKGKTKEQNLEFFLSRTKLDIDKIEFNNDNFLAELKFPSKFVTGEYELYINHDNKNDSKDSIFHSTINIQDPKEKEKPWELNLHKTYELFAKDYIYNDEDKRIKDKGYVIDSIFKDFDTGLYALGLVPNEDGKPPVLFFRGTNLPDTGDIKTDLELNGVGYSQFFDSYSSGSLNEKMENWLKKMNLTLGKADVVGHSLGGALAQRTAVDFSELTGRIITFNSPGIDTRSVERFKGDSSKVFHYIDRDDLVSRSGEKFIPGVVTKISNLFPIGNTLRTLNPILAEDWIDRTLGIPGGLARDFIFNPHLEKSISMNFPYIKEKISIDNLNNLNWNGYFGVGRDVYEEARKQLGGKTITEAKQNIKNTLLPFFPKDDYDYEYIQRLYYFFSRA